VSFERDIIALSAGSWTTTSFWDFTKEQVDVSARHAPVEPRPVDYGAFEKGLKLALGTWPRDEFLSNRGLLVTMVTLTPLFRSYLVFGSSKRPSALALNRVPLVIFALYVIAALALEAGMHAVTYQTVQMLFSRYRAFLALVAMADCTAGWSPSGGPGLRMTAGESADGYVRYLRACRALMSNDQTVATVLATGCESVTVGRLESLEQLAVRLANRIAVSRAANKGWSGLFDGSLAARATLSSVPESVIVRYALSHRVRHSRPS
jgi:hypothetical protein